jgi:hypothetical protein
VSSNDVPGSWAETLALDYALLFIDALQYLCVIIRPQFSDWLFVTNITNVTWPRITLKFEITSVAAEQPRE